MSVGGSIGNTLTTGIQDIAALLPLLGTEQCEEHVSSALDNGYIYAAATPMSIFGSLGLARAGFKAAIAGINISIRNHRFTGAKKLADMGFHPSGSTLPLIMITGDDGDISDKKYLAEERTQKLLEDLQLERARDIEIALHPDMWKWNLRMILITALCCFLSILPYIYLNIEGNDEINMSARWMFPATRALGGFLTASMIQLVIQNRFLTISQHWLNDGRHEHTSGLEDPPKSNVKSAYMWLYVPLLLIGVAATIVGYVGCFSVVQNSQRVSGPFSWFGLEVALSVFRIVLWGSNPVYDDAPPLRYSVTLRKEPPPPTCLYSAEQIIKNRILPLARESEFIESITSFAGLIERFQYAGLSLYYTLTRELHENQCGGRVLYITLVDEKERTTRIYTHDSDGAEHFYFSVSNLPVIGLQNQVFQTEIGSEIMDINNDPVFAKSTVRTNLKFHYQSIMDQLHRRLGDLNSQEYIIENWWSLNSATATFMNEAAWREYMNIDMEWNSAIYEGQRIENSGEDPGATNDNLYFALGRLDEKRKIFINSQHKWISEYFLQAYPSSDGNINKLEVSIFPLFLVENLSMEILALWETHTWELLFLQTSFGILEGVDRLDKVPIWRELRSSCLRRLHVSSQMCSERTQHLDNRLHDHMQKAWKLFTQRYEGEPRSLLKMSQRDVNGLIHDLNELKFWDDTITKSISYTVRDLITKAFSVHYPAENSVLSREMWKRVRTEKRNAENRVRKSLEVSCEPITSSSSILNLGTWTHRMWLCPDSIWEQTELAFSNSVNGLENRILEARRLISTLPCLENVILIYIKSLDIYSPEIVVDLLKAICAMPSVTSIVVDNSLIPPMIRDKWNRMGLPDEIAKCLSENKRLLSVSFDPLPDVERFMRNIVQKNWHCLSEETDRTFMRMLGIKGSGLSRGKLINDARIDISFIGPESSNLSLRITFPPFHDCQTVIPGLEKTSYSSNILSPFAIQMHMNDYLKIIEFESHSSSVVPAVYHVDLHCGEIETHINELYFRPGERNNLTLIITVEAGRTCNLADVELLKDGNPWKPLSEWCTSQHGEFET